MKKLILTAIIFLLPNLGFGVEMASSVSKQITISIDADLILFVKSTIWLGSGFLLVFAALGITFFGWDVRKARGSIADAQKELNDLLKESRKDHESLKELKGRLEELGAQLQEDIESLQDRKEKFEEFSEKPQEGIDALAPSASSLSGESTIPAEGTVSPAISRACTRSKIDLIREVIASSNYEWTTIGRIMKKTGLSCDEILQETRSAPDIIIEYSRQTNNNLFKFDLIKSVLRDPEWLSPPVSD